MDSNCLNGILSHLYEFVSAGNGESTWKCKLCGFICQEYEDTTP